MTGEPSGPAIVAIDPASPSFYRLITNLAAPPFENRQPATHDALLRVRTYARFVLNGSNGKPHCPYVQQTELENGYTIRPYHESPRLLGLDSVLSDIEAEFHRLSPGPTIRSRPLDTTIVLAAFSHPDADTVAFCDRLGATYESNRNRILRQGMLIGYMSPSHPRDEYGESLFKSPIAILSVDRLHRSHIGFMRTPEERAIHASFFGEMPYRPRRSVRMPTTNRSATAQGSNP